MSSDSLAAGGRRSFSDSAGCQQVFGSHTRSMSTWVDARLAAACGCGGARQSPSGAFERPCVTAVCGAHEDWPSGQSCQLAGVVSQSEATIAYCGPRAAWSGVDAEDNASGFGAG
jgi:hypothetical protein